MCRRLMNSQKAIMAYNFKTTDDDDDDDDEDSEQAEVISRSMLYFIYSKAWAAEDGTAKDRFVVKKREWWKQAL